MRGVVISMVSMLALLLSGCYADGVGDSAVGEGGRVLTLATAATSRTSLGERVDDNYPVYWSEGDRVVVNGYLSDCAIINTENPSSAQFTIERQLEYPYNITYPYHSTTTAESPKVLFLAEQSYVEGSFSSGSVPMCGYAVDATSTIHLKHLASLLRLSVKGGAEGDLLQRVVITSTSGAKLSGEFAVDCSTATITPCEDASSSVTYSVNKSLSTSEPLHLYIAIPAVGATECRVELFDGKGESMVAHWDGKGISAGVVKEFSTITYKAGASMSIAPMESYDDSFDIRYGIVYGYVRDTSGNPISGVAVSDGYSVVSTDESGYYSFYVSRDTWYIYISVPSAYRIDTNEYGQPCFYKKYPASSPRYDFTLTPLEGGVEEKFALFAIGDPQVFSQAWLDRFNNEAIVGIKAHSDEVKAEGIPCYGIALGDVISNSNTTDTGGYRDDMRDGFHVDRVGMPVFQVMGNHDCTFFGPNNPIFADETSSTFEIKAQRAHEDIFGPVNYSFNRGKIHVVAMRNIIYTTNDTIMELEYGFFESQYRWLRQDLALVPKDYMVVLCVHAPLFNHTTHYVQEVLYLLDEFAEAHILSGHTHTMRNYEYTVENTQHSAFEHNVNALCGSWWRSNISEDGTPNGYSVFIGEGNSFTDWYYMGYSEGMNSRAHQMRLYRGNTISGGEGGYYAFNYGEKMLLANIYNADSEWVVRVYENGIYTGDMTKVKTFQPKIADLVGSGLLSDPYRAADGVLSSGDMFALGFYRGTTTYTHAWGSCSHLYSFELTDADAEIKVEAVDRFGNVYTESKITESLDYTYIK